MKLSSNGSLDDSFGTGGIVTCSSAYIWQSMWVPPSGPILLSGIGGDNGGDIVLAEYNTDGSADSSFGTGGITTYDFDSVYEVTTLTVLTGGQIQVGALSNVDGCYATVAQFTSSGVLDTSYGTDGALQFSVPGSPWAMMLDSLGNVLVVGSDGGKLFAAEYDTAG